MARVRHSGYHDDDSSPTCFAGSRWEPNPSCLIARSPFSSRRGTLLQQLFGTVSNLQRRKALARPFIRALCQICKVILDLLRQKLYFTKITKGKKEGRPRKSMREWDEALCFSDDGCEIFCDNIQIFVIITPHIYQRQPELHYMSEETGRTRSGI